MKEEGRHFESEEFSFKIHRSWLLCSFYFHHFAANTFLYLPRVLVCEFCSPFSHLYIFFPTEWTLTISSWIIFYSRICPFFTRQEVLSLTSVISFRVNSYQFFLGDKFVFCFVYLFFFPGFSSRPVCPKQKVFVDILRPCGTTTRHVLIVLVVPGKTPVKSAVPGP